MVRGWEELEDVSWPPLDGEGIREITSGGESGSSRAHSKATTSPGVGCDGVGLGVRGLVWVGGTVDGLPQDAEAGTLEARGPLGFRAADGESGVD